VLLGGQFDITDPHADRGHSPKRPAGIEPATRGWKPLVITASLRARVDSVAGVHPYAWPTESDAFALVPALALAYYLVVRHHPVPRWRIGCFVLALALLAAVFATPLETLALNYLLTAHFLQNVTVAEWVPALLVLSLPPQLACRLRVPMVPALVLWLGTYFAWHVPVAYDFALRHPHSILHLEHATYLLAGAALWWPVIHGRQNSGAKAAYLFGAFVLASPLGLLLALLPDAVYPFYDARPTVWGLSHLLDQEIAGTTMAAEQAVVFFAAFAFYFSRFLREEDTPSHPLSSNARTPSTPARQSSSTSSSGRA
jgi:cytochrome c oxidase assembly factor CtaG